MFTSVLCEFTLIACTTSPQHCPRYIVLQKYDTKWHFIYTALIIMWCTLQRCKSQNARRLITLFHDAHFSSWIFRSCFFLLNVIQTVPQWNGPYLKIFHLFSDCSLDLIFFLTFVLFLVDYSEMTKDWFVLGTVRGSHFPGEGCKMVTNQNSMAKRIKLTDICPPKCKMTNQNWKNKRNKGRRRRRRRRMKNKNKKKEQWKKKINEERSTEEE